MADSAASNAAPTALTAAEPVSVVKVVPEQFKIDVVLNEEVFLELTLHNTSSSLCTFKVKTTARDRYLLRPTQDYIPPHGSRQCKIVMAAMRAYPDLSNPKNLKDKFLVQATNIDAEVPDLTKFWKELEMQHNPKAGVYKYAETKIKCKLSVPAKYRAADATKRGEEAEQAAAAAAAAAAERNAQMAALSMQQQQQQQAPAAAAQPRIDDFSERANESGEGARRKPSNDAADFAAMALAAPPSQQQQQQQQQAATAAPVPAAAAPVTLVPMASPAVAAAIAAATSAPLSAAPSSGSGIGVPSDAHGVSRQLAASEAKYAELMEFVVKTTAQLEKERAERESWEGRAQQAAQALASTQIKLENTESKLSAAREEIKRAASSSSSASSSSGSGSKASDEGADLTRRRGKSEGKDASPLSDDDDRSSTAKKVAAATAAVSSVSSAGSPSTPMGGALASKQPAGLTLPLWQIALMALVCFVLGRIFG